MIPFVRPGRHSSGHFRGFSVTYWGARERTSNRYPVRKSCLAQTQEELLVAETPEPTPLQNSISKPSAGRIYDYFCGGDHNYAVDRAAAEHIENGIPRIGDYARECRLVLNRVVRYVSSHGYRQIVDLGAGLPLPGAANVHQIADQVRAEGDTRVVYVDNEPITNAHEEVLLQQDADRGRHQALYGDLLEYEQLWKRIVATGLISFDEPVVLLISSVLHFLQDNKRPDDALTFYRDALPAGSLLMLSTMSNENPTSPAEEQALRELVEFYEHTTNPGQLRTCEEFLPFFGDFELIEPGIVYAPDWYPDGSSLFEVGSMSRILVGLAKKPGGAA